MLKFLCKFGFHKFGNWGDKFSIKNASFAFEFQQRRCERCGIIKERRI